MINQLMVYGIKLYSLLYMKTGICLYDCEIHKKRKYVHFKVWVAPHFMRKASFCLGFLNLLAGCAFIALVLFRYVKTSINGSDLQYILIVILGLVSSCLGLVCMITIVIDVNDLPHLIQIGASADNHFEGKKYKSYLIINIVVHHLPSFLCFHINITAPKYLY